MDSSILEALFTFHSQGNKDYQLVIFLSGEEQSLLNLSNVSKQVQQTIVGFRSMDRPRLNVRSNVKSWLEENAKNYVIALDK